MGEKFTEEEKNTEENLTSTKNKRKKIWRRGNLSRKTRCSASSKIRRGLR